MQKQLRPTRIREISMLDFLKDNFWWQFEDVSFRVNYYVAIVKKLNHKFGLVALISSQYVLLENVEYDKIEFTDNPPYLNVYNGEDANPMECDYRKFIDEVKEQ